MPAYSSTNSISRLCRNRADFSGAPVRASRPCSATDPEPCGAGHPSPPLELQGYAIQIGPAATLAVTALGWRSNTGHPKRERLLLIWRRGLPGRRRWPERIRGARRTSESRSRVPEPEQDARSGGGAGTGDSEGHSHDTVGPFLGVTGPRRDSEDAAAARRATRQKRGRGLIRRPADTLEIPPVVRTRTWSRSQARLAQLGRAHRLGIERPTLGSSPIPDAPCVPTHPAVGGPNEAPAPSLRRTRSHRPGTRGCATGWMAAAQGGGTRRTGPGSAACC